jgi:hypothetical protein
LAPLHLEETAFGLKKEVGGQKEEAGHEDHQPSRYRHHSTLGNDWRCRVWAAE